MRGPRRGPSRLGGEPAPREEARLRARAPSPTMSPCCSPARCRRIPCFGEVEANLAAAEALLGDLAPDLLVVPELFATGYAFRDRAEAAARSERFPDGPTLRWLARASARAGGLAVGGFVERDGDRIYNSAAVCADGRPVLSYRKVHLFGFEREVFDAGPGPFPVVEHRGVRVGVMICFDWRFPEAARTLALAGRRRARPPEQPRDGALPGGDGHPSARERGLHGHGEPHRHRAPAAAPLADLHRRQRDRDARAARRSSAAPRTAPRAW